MRAGRTTSCRIFRKFETELEKISRTFCMSIVNRIIDFRDCVYVAMPCFEKPREDDRMYLLSDIQGDSRWMIPYTFTESRIDVNLST